MEHIEFVDHFHVDENTQKRLLSLALSRGGDFAELYFEYRTSNYLRMEEDILKGSGGGISVGLGVRVLAGDRTGYAYTDDLSRRSMEEAARTAAHIASGPEVDEAVGIRPVEPPRRFPIEQPAHEAALEDRIKLIERANVAARNIDQRISQVNVGFAESLKFVRVMNSEGLCFEDALPMITFNVSCIASSQHGPQRGNFSGGGRRGMEFFHGGKPEMLAVSAAEQALRLCDAVPAPAGQFPVVLAAGDSGVLLHEAVGHGLEADFARKGSSNYSGMVGKRVASKLCTVVDDASIPNSRGSLDADDEGQVGHSNVLIEDGILRGYMQDRISARALEADPTGNGRRESYAHIPLPRMTNTYMLAGDSSREEIFRSTKKGVYAVRFGGGQVDISNGEFTFNITEGYLIEDGRITAPIRGAQLVGNGPDVLRKVVMVADDLELSDLMWTCGKRGQSVPVGLGMPTCKVSSITVGGTGK